MGTSSNKTILNSEKGELVISAHFLAAMYFPKLQLIYELWNDKTEFTAWEERKKFHIEKMSKYQSLDFKHIISDMKEYKNLLTEDDIDWCYDEMFNHELTHEKLEILAIILPPEPLMASAIKMVCTSFVAPYEIIFPTDTKTALSKFGYEHVELNF